MATILIVEDEPYIVDSLRFLLERKGHQVSAVGDGRDALPAIKRNNIDLVILDIMLPGQNGFDVLQSIRRDHMAKPTKVMVLTAKGQAQDRQRMRDLGADEFCTKPYSNSDIVDRVERLLLREPTRAHG